MGKRQTQNMSLSFFLAFFVIDRISSLEPGKSKQDLESIEEIQGHEDSSTTEQEPEDLSWVPDAVLDVGYYLRKFKNFGYDPRYLTDGAKSEKNLYENFPSPPLKILHWEVDSLYHLIQLLELRSVLFEQVKKNCETSFLDCLRYLQDKITQTELPRHLDSLTVIKHNGWTMEKDRDLIKATDDACVELRGRDEKTFNVFQGPLQKFQWLTSASYYMCWFTMKEIYHLGTFSDDCDNFANCLDWTTGPSNRDVRANNKNPFACARYSFCPDPCCPVKLAQRVEDCAEVNPCSRHQPKDDTCFMDRKKNLDFESLMLNYWNISCACDVLGFRWESKSGMCVDVDECIENNTCQIPAQSCLNLPGTYQCLCSILGYTEDGEGNCIPDTVVQRVIHPPKVVPRQKSKTIGNSFFDFVYRLKSAMSGYKNVEEGESLNGTENLANGTTAF